MLEAHGLTLGLAILVQVLEGPILVGVGEGVRKPSSESKFPR